MVRLFQDSIARFFHTVTNSLSLASCPISSLDFLHCRLRHFHLHRHDFIPRFLTLSPTHIPPCVACIHSDKMNWVGGSGRRRKRGGERRDTKPFIVRGSGAHGGAGLRRLGGGSSGASKHTLTATAPSSSSSSSFRGVLKPKQRRAADGHSKSSDMVALELLSATSK